MSIPSNVCDAIHDVRDVERISALIIPAAGDQFWTEGARLVLSAMLMHCIRTHGRNWGWPQLAALLDLPPERLLPLLAHAHPIIVERMQLGRVTDSIVLTVAVRVSAAAACLHTVGADDGV